MEPRRVRQIRDELHELLVQQIKALEADTFGGLNKKEWHEFDKRHERIRELIACLLSVMGPAALARSA